MDLGGCKSSLSIYLGSCYVAQPGLNLLVLLHCSQVWDSRCEAPHLVEQLLLHLDFVFLGLAILLTNSSTFV
jgi:hypothetical protein